MAEQLHIILGLFAAEPAIVQNLRQTPRIFIPSIVSGELYYGALRSTRVQDNLARIEQLAARNIVLDCNGAIQFKRPPSQLETRGV